MRREVKNVSTLTERHWADPLGVRAFQKNGSMLVEDSRQRRTPKVFSTGTRRRGLASD